MHTTTPQTLLRTKDEELLVGDLPRVVGTLSSLSGDLPSESREVPCDIVEVRLDEVPDHDHWLDRCQSIEASGLPVILTARLKCEGGRWGGSEKARLDLFDAALHDLSCVDVEFKSEISVSVSKLAARLGKSCIVSYHDFRQTPPIKELRSIVSRAQKLASIVKVSTMVKTDADVETLRNLLFQSWEVPLCVIGMGPSGTQSRISFATLGSCMTYGYLDRPSAPGQLPASSLVQTLRTLLPQYNEDFVIRKQVLEYA